MDPYIANFFSSIKRQVDFSHRNIAYGRRVILYSRVDPYKLYKVNNINNLLVGN